MSERIGLLGPQDGFVPGVLVMIEVLHESGRRLLPLRGRASFLLVSVEIRVTRWPDEFIFLHFLVVFLSN